MKNLTLTEINMHKVTTKEEMKELLKDYKKNTYSLELSALTSKNGHYAQVFVDYYDKNGDKTLSQIVGQIVKDTDGKWGYISPFGKWVELDISLHDSLISLEYGLKALISAWCDWSKHLNVKLFNYYLDSNHSKMFMAMQHYNVAKLQYEKQDNPYE